MGLVTFGHEVIKKIKLLVAEVKVLPKTSTDKKPFCESVENALAQLRSSVSASNALTA